jgi:tape measure domain-containing protein
MAGFIYNIQVNVLGNSKLQQIVDMSSRFETQLEKINGKLDTMGSELGNLGQKGKSAFGGLTSGVGGLVAGLGLAAATMSSLKTAADMEGLNRSIMFASGAKEGVTNLKFVGEAVDALGLPLQGSLDGFKKLLGGVQGTGVSMQQTRDIFYSVGEAATVMGVSGDQVNGVFLALSQMASKGKVSAEELRGQLGERLPGAFNIASRAMGLTTAAMDKMMSDGKIMANDFLPKFAKQLHKEFGGGVADAAKSATANFNRFETSVFRLKDTFGKELMPSVLSLLDNYLIPAASWIGQHIVLLTTLGATLGVVWAGYKIYAITTSLATAATALFSGELGILGVIMNLNPIGLIVTGLVALAAGVMYAWNKFEGFRGFIVGMWEVLKVFGKFIYDFAIAPLVAFGEILMGIFTFDTSLIQKGMDDSLNVIKSNINNFTTAGQQIGEAFNKGYNDGVAIKTANAEKKYVSPSGISSYLKDTGKNTEGAKPDEKTKKGIDDITGGGKGAKNVTISINTVKISDQLTIQNDASHNAPQQLTDDILKKLIQIINSANSVQFG